VRHRDILASVVTAILAAALAGCTPGARVGGDPGSTGGSDPGSGSDGDGPGSGETVDPDSLRALAGPELPYLGAAVNVDALRSDQAYRQVLAREYNILTPENALKWAAVHPAPEAWTFGDADDLVAAAQASRQAIHGHVLVWHQQLPDWVNDSLGKDGVQAALDQHIDTVVGRYRGKIAIWDVVNEAIDDQGKLRDSVFSRQLGADFIASAFRRARAADPTAILGYNEYGIETGGAKADAVFALLQGLVQSGVPIDAVGLQFHLSAYELAVGRQRGDAIRATIERFAALGLRVYISELDVRIADLSGAAADRLAYQRKVYELVTAICRDEPACDGVTTWGFTDRFSWIDSAYGPDDPLPFDESYQRKPAYLGIRDALDGAAAGAVDGIYNTACGATITGAAFCDPLESDRLEGLFLSATSGSAAAVATPAYRGNLAYRAATTSAASPQAVLGRTVFDSVKTGTLYMRTYVYLPAAVMADGVTLFGPGENALPYHGVTVALTTGGKLALSESTANRFAASTTVLPRDRWTCLGLKIVVNGTAGSAVLSMNNTAVLTDTGFNTAPAGGYANVNFGVLFAPANAPGVTVYFDEVAASTQPLPCDP
jgi:GH35 family endo-1,4-beta-xylanase